MTAALIGIVGIQMYWIKESIQQNEETFDKSVYDALNKVAHKVVIDEPNVLFSDIGDHNPVHADQAIQTGVTIETAIEAWVGETVNQIRIDQRFDHFSDTDCNCEECRFKRKKNLVDYIMVKQLLKPKPVEERIHNKRLASFIKDELTNHGINIPYEFGVYSMKSQSFVILNSNYQVPDFNDNDQKSNVYHKRENFNLENSKYQVQLFSEEINPPGLLMVHFPSKASIVWGSVWKVLLASILFTGIILFCFAYTIQVIFTQKKVSEMKTDFINNMTHEFKTPIATISLAADSIVSPMIVENSSKVMRFADIIKQENKRMLNQVEKVLQMAQIDKKEFKLNITSVNLHEVIGHAVTNINLQVEKKSGTVSTSLEATEPVIQADMTHVSNIINNLLDNANKYSPQNPEISLHTRNVSNGVEVIIKDRGIGMSKEAKKHIFDKFYRVHTGNLHDVKGFGLGLSYVKALITAHNGEINVKSELGKGSSFILYFPSLHAID